MRRRWPDARGRGRWRHSALLLVALGASACAKGALFPSATAVAWCDEGPSYGTETATVGGSAWAPVRVGAVGLIGAGPLEVNASDCHRTLDIWFASNPGPGTYTLANGVNVSSMAEPGDTGGGFLLPSSPGSATVTLTEVSATTISGTFEITIGPYVFTNGRFDVHEP